MKDQAHAIVEINEILRKRYLLSVRIQEKVANLILSAYDTPVSEFDTAFECFTAVKQVFSEYAQSAGIAQEEVDVAAAFLYRAFHDICELSGEKSENKLNGFVLTPECCACFAEDCVSILRGIPEMGSLLCSAACTYGSLFSHGAPNESEEGKDVATDMFKLDIIPQAPDISFPTGKPFRLQHNIAKNGLDGAEINVGEASDAKAVIISASIAHKDGSTISINDIEKGVQRAIGNLIEEAGHLPICVSPAQIFRAYACLPPSAVVRPNQARQMEEVVDKLMGIDGKIDFKAQLKTHKHIKQQPDIDYTSPKAGYLEGHLITGLKTGIQAPDGTWVIGYRIHEFPMFYQHSRAVGQIARLTRKVVSIYNDDLPAICDDDFIALPKVTARDVAYKENVLSRVTGMKSCKKRKKRFSPVIRIEDIAADNDVSLSRQSERTLLKNVGHYLERLKKEKQIKGYSEHKKGRKIDGYSVDV